MKCSVWLSLVIVIASLSPATAGIIITPGPSVSLNTLPFGGTDDLRYQQVYGASLFTDFSFAGQDLITGPIAITGLRFSPNMSGIYEADVLIRLATTATPVGLLTTSLDTNYSGTLTTVFSDPTFSQTVSGGDLTYSLDFDFSTPFIYDPTSGANLLVDITVKDKIDGWAFYRGNGHGVTSRATADFTGDGGLRTLLEFEPVPQVVPEPASLALWASLAVASLLGRSVTRRRVFSETSGEN